MGVNIKPSCGSEKKNKRCEILGCEYSASAISDSLSYRDLL